MMKTKFGRLTIIEPTEKRYHGSIVYKCQCDCGNIVEINSNKLNSGHTKSCGCLKTTRIDLINKRYGRLVAKKYIEKSKWLCLCDCGNECVVVYNSLKYGDTKSCGCLNTEVRTKTIKEKFGMKNGTSISAINKTRKLNKNSTSGYKGVSWSKRHQQWVAQIMLRRKTYNLGRFDNIEDAINARKKAEDEMYGPLLQCKK